MTFAIKGGCWVGVHNFLHFLGHFLWERLSKKYVFVLQIFSNDEKNIYIKFALFTWSSFSIFGDEGKMGN